MTKAQITVNQIIHERDELRTDPFFGNLVIIAQRVAKKVGVVSVLIGVDQAYRGDIEEFVYWPWIEFVQDKTKVRLLFERQYDPPHNWVPYSCAVNGLSNLRLRENWNVDNLHEYIVEKLRQGPWELSLRLAALFERVLARLKSLLSR